MKYKLEKETKPTLATYGKYKAVAVSLIVVVSQFCEYQLLVLSMTVFFKIPI